MNESFRSGKPAERTYGRRELREEVTRTQSHWAIEGRIESVRVKRSVRYVALVREGDRRTSSTPDTASRAQRLDKKKDPTRDVTQALTNVTASA